MDYREYKPLFLEETKEHLTELNKNLILIEKDQTNKEYVDNIFRIMHTLKSSAAAVGYNGLSELTHSAEDLIEKIRIDDQGIAEKLIDILFDISDSMNNFLNAVQEDQETDFEFNDLIIRIQELFDSSSIKASDNNLAEAGIDDVETVTEDVEEEIIADIPEIEFSIIERDAIDAGIKSNKTCFLVSIVIDPREQLKWMRAELLLTKIEKIGKIIKTAPDKEIILSSDSTGVFTVLMSSAENGLSILKKLKIDLIKRVILKEIKLTKKGYQFNEIIPPKSEVLIEHKKIDKLLRDKITTGSDTIRVPIRKLDHLMNLIGELVITISGLKKTEQDLKETYSDDELYNEVNALSDKLVNVSTELQNGIMNTRMLPVSDIFNQFHRITRDLAREEGKNINLILAGENTELDKKVIDRIGNPLVNLVKNAIIHGIEKPEIREKTGKTPEGTIVLSASRFGNNILISILDDGKGISIDKIKKEALELELIKKENINKLSKNQILNLIYEAGFTMSDDHLGTRKGIGLNEVKQAISSLDGTIDLKTEEGIGTEFLISLPLTLTIISAILVDAGENTYAIPIADIIETIKIEANDIINREGNNYLNLRDEFIPLIDIKNVFKNKDIKIGMMHDVISVIIVNYQHKKLGLIIDKINGSNDIVLKPLENNYRSVKGLAGASLMGDGSIVLIIDIMDLIELIKEGGQDISFITEQNNDYFVNQQTQAVKYGIEVQNINLKKIDLDINMVLRDIFKRTFKDATVSLSRLTNKEIKIYGSKLFLMSGRQFVKQFDDNLHNEYFGSIMRIRKQLNTNIVLIVSEAEALHLYDIIGSKRAGITKEVSDDVVSGIGEINNILGSAFLNTIANLINKEISPNTPVTMFDVLHEFLHAVVLKDEFVDKRMLCADTVIKDKAKGEFHARFLIMSDKQDLINLLKTNQ